MNKSIKYQLVDVVPFQTCPICNVVGKIVADGFLSGIFQTCDVCHGQKIIPMATLPGVNWRIEEN